MYQVFLKKCIALVMTITLISCGGGGGGGGGSSEPTLPTGSTTPTTNADLGDTIYWTFDNLVSNIANNTTFDGLPITFTGASVAPGKYGSAISFNENLDVSYGQITGNAIPMNGTDPYIVLDFPDNKISFAAWINPRKIDGTSTYQIIGDGLYGIKSFSVLLQNGKLQVVLDQSNVLVTSSSAVSTNTWTHVAFSYDGQQAQTYINGTVNSTNSVLFKVPQAVNKLYVGGRATLTASDRVFPGAIDEMYLSLTPLSPAKIAILMSGSRP